MPKRGLGIDVLTAARERIAWTFDKFPKICVSFSGGKDSTCLLHLTMEEAIKRGRKVAVLFVDLEGQYQLTIEHVQTCYDLYRDHIDPYWVALPLHLRNAVSQFQPQWICWEPEAREIWVREQPKMAITEQGDFPFYRYRMEFEEFVEEFAWWYADDQFAAFLVGIRAQESLNRFRTLIQRKQRMDGKQWTTYKGKTAFNVYPIYDWQTEDVWRYSARCGKPYNRLYDRMFQAGLTIHQMRICQPYGDDQRKGLWLFHLIEPQTWGRVVARVNGANGGALYAQETGNILGVRKINKPPGHTWQSFARLLIDSMPPATREHFENKIETFLHWWSDRGYPTIPEEASIQDEAKRKAPSWRRVCKAILRYDYWCKGLSFSQHKGEAYEKYLKIMKRRRQKWGFAW